MHVAGFIALMLLSVFYLQFGLQALVNFIPQGLLAILGAGSLGWGGVRMIRRSSGATIVFVGTAPLAVLHAVMTLVEAGELPFLIGSLPVPVGAGVRWLVRRRRAAVVRVAA